LTLCEDFFKSSFFEFEFERKRRIMASHILLSVFEGLSLPFPAYRLSGGMPYDCEPGVCCHQHMTDFGFRGCESCRRAVIKSFSHNNLLDPNGSVNETEEKDYGLTYPPPMVGSWEASVFNSLLYFQN